MFIVFAFMKLRRRKERKRKKRKNQKKSIFDQHRYPEHQDKIVAEITQHVGFTGSITSQHIKSLAFLDMFIKEGIYFVIFILILFFSFWFFFLLPCIFFSTFRYIFFYFSSTLLSSSTNYHRAKTRQRRDHMWL